MSNKKIIERFYEAFAENDAEKMTACYHDEIEFTDPAFGTLKGDEAKNMWKMLVEKGKGNIKIDFKNVTADDKKGSADWTANYVFSQTGRNVVNRIHAEFKFQDDKIIRHVDDFDAWKWSRQALGLPGLLLGWTSLMKNKVRQKARASLNEYSRKSGEKR